MAKKEKIIVPSLSEQELEEIDNEIEGLEIEVTGYDISGFKKGWRKQYETVTYSDGLSTEEGKIFKDDPEFIRLAVKIKKDKIRLNKYMNLKLRKFRAEHPKELTMQEKAAKQKREREEVESLKEHLLLTSGIKEA